MTWIPREAAKLRRRIGMLARRAIRTRNMRSNPEDVICAEDAICNYPQSGERILGQKNLQALRIHHPGKPSGFKVHRMVGSGELWLTEYLIAYEGRSAYTVSIMEFREGKVVHETQYSPTRLKPRPGDGTGLRKCPA